MSRVRWLAMLLPVGMVYLSFFALYKLTPDVWWHGPTILFLLLATAGSVILTVLWCSGSLDKESGK